MDRPVLGFLGLGIMGHAMATNLLQAGYRIFVYNRTPEKARKLVEQGAGLVDSPAVMQDVCDIVLSCVTDDQALCSLFFDSGGLVHELAPSSKKLSLVIDHSTISPEIALEIGAKLSQLQIGFLDAPVSGGDVGARQGTLTVMAGGEAKDFERALPILTTIGGAVHHTGESGSGQMTKAVNQVVVALSVAAMTEGMILADSFGLDVQKTLEILSSGAAGSWSIDNYAPRVLRGDLAPGFYAKDMLKDLRIALDQAGKRELSLPMAHLIEELYAKLCALQDGALLGNHALCRLYQDGS